MAQNTLSPRVPEERKFSADELAQILKVGRRTIWRWTAQGKLPPPIYFSPRTARWRERDIRHILDQGISK